MPIKEKSTFKKQEFEYVSPDGDKWTLVCVEHENRRYLQISKEGEDVESSVKWDLDMLFDISDQLRGVSGRQTTTTTRSFVKPEVTDMRSNAERIQLSVDNSMTKLGKEEPFESFNTDPDSLAQMRSGVDMHSQPAVSETPKEWSLKNRDAEWKQDVAVRLDKPKPNYKKRGSDGTGFKRVGADDLI